MCFGYDHIIFIIFISCLDIDGLAITQKDIWYSLFCNSIIYIASTLINSLLRENYILENKITDRKKFVQ